MAAAALIWGASLALLAHGPASSGSRHLDLTGVGLAAGSTLPLVAWRRFPLGVFLVTAVAGVALAGLGYPIEWMLGPAAALYLLAAGREGPTRWTAPAVIASGGLLVAYLGAAVAGRRASSDVGLFHTPLICAVAWLAGERTRLRREQMAELRARVLRAERETEREHLLAVAQERARIARDLHDSAGHAISVIVVRAGAARLRHHDDPDRSLLALEAIEELARQTVTDIDRMVATLRDDGSADGTPPATPLGLASLGTLIGHSTAAGLEVTVDTSGAPRALGGAADQAAYRILQEALTNAARHGAGPARIGLIFGSDALEVTVTNPVDGPGGPRAGGGHGLIGMRERATLLGGSLDAEGTNGSFSLRARIPYEGRVG